MADSKCRWKSPEDWSEWSEWLAAGLDARNRWRLPILLTGMLLASGRRTVTTWLRAAGVSDDYQDYYYFLTSVVRAMLYVRRQTMPTIPKRRCWHRFATKRYKTFLATYKPAGRIIRVVLVPEEDHGWHASYCTDLTAGVQEFIEAFADRASIEQDFHDVKEVWGTGQQQVRNIWNNLAAYNLNLWTHTMVELWAYSRSSEQLVDRSDSPSGDPIGVLRTPTGVKLCGRRSCEVNYGRSLPSGGFHKKSFDSPTAWSPWRRNQEKIPTF